jgi:hypothetical protein
MKLSDDEKEYLRQLVERELKHLKDEKPLTEGQASLGFVVAEENYEKFIEDLLEKLRE